MKEKKERHFKNCSAPICCCDPNKDYKDEVVWCPGEDICRWKPYQKFQEQQAIINKLFRKGKIEDGSFPAHHLEKVRFTKSGRISAK